LLGSQAVPVILVSGNIEAHQSVLGFKLVQSRIVELPFDEGQWVDAGTLIARLDDSDYRQQVAINEANVENAAASAGRGRANRVNHTLRITDRGDDGARAVRATDDVAR